MYKSQTFLGELASKIVENNTISLEKHLIVLPNKRAKRVLQKNLANLIDKPHFSPTILTINEFIESLSPIKSLKNDELLLLLYETCISFTIFKDVSFQKFLAWGPIFLSDINEIDLQLAPAEQIFVNLSEAKELETTFLKGELSDLQKSYLTFYKNLNQIYASFTSHLKEEKKGYEGLIYRSVAEQLNASESHDSEILNSYKKFKQFIFAGFHALSPSEMAIFEFFYNHFNVGFHFDIDHFYNIQYTPFVKTLQNRLRIPDINIKDQFREIPKDIHITSVNGNIAQIYHAIDLLTEIESKEGNLDETVLVFGDETLVVPFVHAYDCTKANLTMGYPLKNTTVYHIIKTLFRLTKNSERFSKLQNESSPIYYHKDIITFLQNPVIVSSFYENSEKANAVINDLIFKNRVFLHSSELPSSIPILPSDGIPFLQKLMLFLEKLISKMDSNSIDFTLLQLVMEGMKETIEMLQNYQVSDRLSDLSSLEYFVFEKLDRLTIPFIGDFDKGLQVCGLLETRTLDYKNIIFLSINEGVLPKGNSQPSLILFDIKNHFKLPTSIYKDSIFAYHFFRLMQRAKLIHILYDNDSSSSLAEESRFINQLEFEIQNQQLTSTVHIIKKSLNTPTKQTVPEHQIISIQKDDRILQKLFEIHYSPTNLSTYINCPLAFYLSQVEKLEIPDSIDEKIENKIVGTIIHSILETIFEEIRIDPLQFDSIIQHNIQNIDTIVAQYSKANRDLKNADIHKGKIFLSLEIIKKNILGYLKLSLQELKKGDIEIKGNEVQLLSVFETQYGKIKIKGKIDRVDYREGCVTILDYKTGYVDAKKLKFTDFEKLFSDTDQKQLFQLIMYLYMYHKDQSDTTLLKTQTYSSGIISFQEVLLQNENHIHYAELALEKRKSTKEISITFLEEWESYFKQFIERILDPNEPFHQTNDPSHCTYCDFKSLCRKGLIEKKY